jgi:hypothetical protein
MRTGDCGGCHTPANWNSTALPSNHMPNPAGTACNTCHIAAPTNYATLAANSVLHTGISSNCIQCHGVTQLNFYNNNDPPKPMVAGHIPSSTTPCEACHSSTTFTAFSGTTMSSAKHTSMFAVIGGTCDGCHDLPKKTFYGVTNLTVRPSTNHHAGQDCSSSGCHGTSNWDPLSGNVKKAAAPAAATAPATLRTKVGVVISSGAARRGTAAELASAPGGLTAARAAGAQAPVSSAGGVTTPLVATTPRGARMSHTGVTSNCASCHNGVLAAGKGPTHVESNDLCENCHLTAAWLPARFEHQGVTASCVSCHNGVKAPGKPTRHIQANQDCSACHGTISWQSVQFSHAGISATCQSCHNGITATGKQLGHPSTALDCGICHGSLTWAVTAAPSRLPPLLQRPRTPRGATAPPSPAAAKGGSIP